ncbi:Translation factor GUF1 homolog, mitochondrial-like protein [Drosera capensis]
MGKSIINHLSKPIKSTVKSLSQRSSFNFDHFPCVLVAQTAQCGSNWYRRFCSKSRGSDGGFDLGEFPPERIRNFRSLRILIMGNRRWRIGCLSWRGRLRKGMGSLSISINYRSRERGITVKAETATMFYKHNCQQGAAVDAQAPATFLLNLIGMPGPVDFSYEVSRSLAVCQGALLVVDAAQGVQVQTVANFYLAFESNLTIIPIINKIDQPTNDPDRVKAQLKSMFDLDPTTALLTSAKTGQGLENVLPAVIDRMPPPPGQINLPLRMLLLDSYYDEYKGVICHVAVVDGTL